MDSGNFVVAPIVGVLCCARESNTVLDSNHFAHKESLLLYLDCVVAICVLCPFLIVSWVGLQSVIVTFPGHILFYINCLQKKYNMEKYGTSQIVINITCIVICTAC